MFSSSFPLVPNIVHFIRFGNSTLTFIDAVCILAALKNQKPNVLMIHSDQKNFDGGKYWRVVIDHPTAKGVVQVKYRAQPDNIYGQPFSKQFGLYHKSDVERLRILMEYGGIYCDNDLYIVDSLDIFRNYEMTLGWEEGGGISDQVIIASKDARFLKIWLESYIDYRGNSWFYNGGELPTMILKKRPYLVNSVKNGLAEYRTTVRLIYYKSNESWKYHYAIHLLIGHQRTLLSTNLSDAAPYPVVFNETNILNYEANIKYMAIDVYPRPKVKRKKHKYSKQ
ncbi:hypothetical protein GE061_005835 [Apolygus lucorum]|uniref:Alpha-1,4-N-acetylglucosaminyltransferase n=1 Tax=Apolygus lucorum TaxID=248454 RepID=A0A8S9WXD9_APOLU|nr:hypothetical protein GE061_005835 [Apolygus lucorum]